MPSLLLKNVDVITLNDAGDVLRGVDIGEGRSFGQTGTPQTGRREVPIAGPLARPLAPATQGERDGYLALTRKGRLKARSNRTPCRPR